MENLTYLSIISIFIYIKCILLNSKKKKKKKKKKRNKEKSIYSY